MANGNKITDQDPRTPDCIKDVELKFRITKYNKTLLKAKLYNEKFSITRLFTFFLNYYINDDTCLIPFIEKVREENKRSFANTRRKLKEMRTIEAINKELSLDAEYWEQFWDLDKKQFYE